MFTINGQEFEVYAIDSADTLKDRIAAHFNTLYKYLRFSPLQPVQLQDFTGDFTVENLLPYIINQEETGFTLKDKVLNDYPQLDLVKDVEEPFVAFNSSYKEHAVTRTGAQGFSESVENMWDKRKTIEDNLNKQLSDAFERVRKHDEIYNMLKSYKPVQYTQFYGEKTKYLIDFGPVDTPIEDVYSRMKTTDNVPYMVLNNISKLQTDFTPSSAMIEAKYPVGYIVMKVNAERETGVREIKDVYKRYSDAIFAVEDGRLISTMMVQIGKRNVNSGDFQKRVMETFGHEAPLVVKLTKKDSSGVFYCPHQSLDTTIFTDMVMNRPEFYNVLAVDESVRISKVKMNVYMKALYGSESFALQMNVATKGDIPPGILEKEKYIRVRISRATTDAHIARLQDFIARLIAVYNKWYTQVVVPYKQYVPNLQLIALVTAETRKNVKQMTLNEIAPDVFPERYSRQCPRFPTIISDEEAATTSRVVMRFPIKNESITRNYICNYTELPFPGLQINTRAINKDTFKYLPCCYAKDQRLKRGSAYNNYYNQEPLRRGTQTQDVFRTGKFLPPGALGILPQKIDDFFNTMLTPDKQIMRCGINITRRSFLEAVLVAKNIINIGNLKKQSHVQEIDRRFALILTLDYATAAKQELYGKSVEEIMEIMRTGDLRATWFVNVLEIAFDCNIYIFTDEDGGMLRVPDHKMQYYKFRPRKSAILVYQHWGSEANAPQFPHCELMVVADRDNVKNQQIIFPFQSDVEQKVSNAFLTMTKKYTLAGELEPILMTAIPVLYQYIDAYGKCRMICTYVDDVQMTVMLPPCPPFAKRIDSAIIRVKLQQAMMLVDKYGLEILEQRERNKRTVELVVSLGSINGVILIDDDPTHLDGIYISSTPRLGMYYNDNRSPLKDMIRLEKTARILGDVAMWQLSRYVGDNKVTRETLTKFLNDKVQIDNYIDYEIDEMSPRFRDVSNKMIFEDKLVVPNIEILKRLLYHLSMVSHTSPDLLKSYRKLDMIPSFFSSVTDFRNETGEYVLDSKSAIDNLLKTKKRDSVWNVVDSVRINTEQTYFFKNKLIGDNVFFAQNAHSYMHANYIINTLRTTGINPGTFFRVEEEETVGVQSEAMDVSESSGSSQSSELFDQDLFDVDIDALLGEFQGPVYDDESVPVVKGGDNKDDAAPTATATEVVAPLLPDTPLISFEIYSYVNASNITLLRQGDGPECALAYKIGGQPMYTVLFTKTK